MSSGDFSGRVRSCWALVALGADSLEWVQRGLASGEEDRIEDAAGVLAWIDAPTAMIPSLRELLGSLREGEAADAVAAALERIAGPEPATSAAPASAQLYEGRLAAFTTTIWYVDAPFEQVVETGTEWLTGLGGRSFTPLDGRPLEGMLAELEPWAMGSWKQLWVATDSNWTAIFSQGSDISTHSVVARRIGCRSLRTSYSPRVIRDKQTVSYGDTAFWFEEGDGSGRSIQASFQSRWEWYLQGEPLPFEDHVAYAEKRIHDRFTLDGLNSYCAALGIRRNDPAFYRPRGLLVEEDTSSWPGKRRSMTSAEWLARNR